MHDLSGFQRDLLYVIAGVEESYGLAIYEELEEYYNEDVYTGRLYPNLDALAERGLVEKGEYDERTNHYELTDQGRRELKAHQDWKEGHLESELVE